MAPPRPLVIGCGALAHELVELTRRAGLPAMDLTCLPAMLHNRPERIPGAVRAKIRAARARGVERIFVAYADCGTGGLLDRVLEDEGVERLAGAHCYEVYGGRAAFARLQNDEPGTFYLTDFLARNGDRLVWRGLGLDRHPELLPLYFGNYRRVVYLAQTDDPALTTAACSLARRLGLAFERRFTGLGELSPAIAAFATAPVSVPTTGAPGPLACTGAPDPTAVIPRATTSVPVAPYRDPQADLSLTVQRRERSARRAVQATRQPGGLLQGQSRSGAHGAPQRSLLPHVQRRSGPLHAGLRPGMAADATPAANSQVA